MENYNSRSIVDGTSAIVKSADYVNDIVSEDRRVGPVVTEVNGTLDASFVFLYLQGLLWASGAIDNVCSFLNRNNFESY